VRRAAVIVVLALLSLEPLPRASADSVRVVAVERLAPRRPPVAPQPGPSGPPREVAPLRGGPGNASGVSPDETLGPVQDSVVAASTPTPGLNFAGFAFNGSFPPDPAGEVGTTQFVHTANSIGGAEVAVFDKTTGAVVRNFMMSSLASSGVCQHGLGDGVPFFDQLDARWILTEIATRRNSLCVYVSQTDDATSSYTPYSIHFNVFPDYPKWAVWPNAFYLGFNNSGFSDPIVALNKATMIAGAPLMPNDVIVRNIGALPAFGFQLLSPVDLDGDTPPPAAAPGVFVRHRAHDFVQYVELSPDFVHGTANVTGPVSVAVSSFNSRLCGRRSDRCVPQRGTTVRLDSLNQPVMNRPTMRVVGSDQLMVGSFTVNVGDSRAGVRWFELMRPAATVSGSWTLDDEGTYAPKGLHRWVPSVDIDVNGDIALGFSASSGRTFPSIRITGRLAGDTQGVMTQGETVLMTSAGAQTFASRWGDYTEMSVDPVDGTTFWYTNEYLNRRGEWRTWISSFSLGP